MKNALRTTAFVLSFVILFTQFAHAAKLSSKVAAAAAAADAAAIQAPSAPVPSQIASAHNVFLASSGTSPNFPSTDTAAYNAVYASLKSWGYYQLVSTPQQADLIFQLRGVAPITQVSGVHGSVSSYTSPAFQLTIVDAKTKVALWTITSPVVLSGKQKEFEKWFTLSVNNLTSRVKVLASVALTPPETAQLTERPRTHNTRTILLATGIPLALFGVAFYIAKRKSDDFATEHDLTCATNPFFCTN